MRQFIENILVFCLLVNISYIRISDSGGGDPTAPLGRQKDHIVCEYERPKCGATLPAGAVS